MVYINLGNDRKRILIDDLTRAVFDLEAIATAAIQLLQIPFSLR